MNYICCMINIYISDLGQSIRAIELYDYLGLEKSHYSRFIKKEVLNNPYADDKSYSPIWASERKQGRFRQDYHFHIDFAKKICMVSKSAKGEQIRNELVELTKKVENLDYLTTKQVLYTTHLKEVFKYVANCKEAEALHLNKFVFESSNKDWAYADFHKMRNAILGLGKEVIDRRLKEYCIEKSISTNAKTKMDKMLLIDRFEVLRNGVWDYLMANNQHQSMKLAELAMEMAKIEGTPMFRKNETDLFRVKEDNRDVQSIKLLPQ